MRKQVTCPNGFLFAFALGSIAIPAWGQVVNEQFKLLASDGAVFDNFGYATAIKDGVVVVGAISNDNLGISTGAVYLFDASTGVQTAKFFPVDGVASGGFGSSVAIDNGVVAVGARWDEENGWASGSAYLFDVETGDQLFKLSPDDGAEEDAFGTSIAIGSGVVAVGAPWTDEGETDAGSVYLFDALTGVQIMKILASDATESARFGGAVAIDDGILAVGASHSDDFGGDSGSAYLFDLSTGVQLFKLLPDDAASNDWFADSIAIDNGIVAAGARLDDDNGNNSGSVYLFDASTGDQIMKILPDDGAMADEFGSSVAIRGGVVVAGAWYDTDNGFRSGSAYAFDANTGTQIAKLLPSDGAAGDWFGVSVGVDRGQIVVGSWLNAGTGSAYVFDIRCPADINGDGLLDISDVFAFLDAYNAGNGAIADLTGDGMVDISDVFAFLDSYTSGCV